MIAPWIKLAAASKDELYGEIITVIEEMGGVEAAEQILRQLASEKTSNWVLTERFVTANTTLERILDEQGRKVRKDWEDRKIVNKPAPDTDVQQVEAPEPEKIPEAKVPENVPTPDSPIKEGPEYLSRGVYLSTLLGLLLGLGGGLAQNKLKNIDLKKMLADYKAGHDTSKVPSERAKELLEEPLNPSMVEEPRGEVGLSEEEYAKQKEQVLSQVEVWKKQVAEEKDPAKQKEMRDELREFVRMNKTTFPELQLIPNDQE